MRPAELAIDAQAEPADLTVDIVGTPANDGRSFLVTVRTSLLDDFAMTEPEPWNFPQGTDALVAETDGPVHAQGRHPLQPPGVAARGPASTSGMRRRSASRRSSGACSTSSSRCARSSSRPRSRTSPGSSCSRTASRRAASREEREALGVEFVIGRWVHPGHRSPKQHDPIGDSYVVAPTYPVRPLKTSADEAAWVCDRFAGTTVTPAEQARLDEMLRERPVGLLHFVAHGKSDPGRGPDPRARERRRLLRVPGAGDAGTQGGLPRQRRRSSS